MALYQYIKSQPEKFGGPKKKKPRSKIIPFLFMGAGAMILAWVAWPIVSFILVTAPLISATVSPVGNDQGGTLAPVVLAASGAETATADYLNPNIWFPTMPQKKVVTPVNVYSLSIPKVKLENAKVTVAGDDLNTSLVHYGGTGLPGDYGTTVIFGHSVLPQFYDPTNYKTIFSLLPTLKTGDDIFITFDGITYRYSVFDMVVTEPNDLSALEQKFDDSYLTLITCVPPGTFWKRLDVKAKLVRPPT